MWKEHVLLGCKVMVALLTLSPCIGACHVCPMSNFKGGHPSFNGTLVIPHSCCNILICNYLISFDLDILGKGLLQVVLDVYFLRILMSTPDYAKLCLTITTASG